MSNLRTIVSCIEKICRFYTAPWTVAGLSLISYCIFLTIFSHVLLVDISESLTVLDIILIIWVFSMFTEELHQCFTQKAKCFGKQVSSYIKNDYNKGDILSISLFVIGTVLRIVPGTQSLSAGRLLLGISFLISVIRILQIFTVNKQLGPWLVMIRRMTVNLVYFFIILLVFVVAYAISAHAIAFPNTKLDWMLAYDVLRTGYWNVYGELFLDEIEVEEPQCSFNETIYSTDPDIVRCPTEAGRYFVPILRGLFVLFSNILLLNLLIAIFCKTHDSIKEKADIHWSFERYVLIREYTSRPSLPAPLIIICHLRMLISWIFWKGCACNHEGNVFKKYCPTSTIVS